MKELNIYDLMKSWFDFCFENPEMINPNHSALYFFILSHSNRLGWKPKIGLPSTMAKEAIGMKSYKTYISTLNDLVEFGFVEMLERSRNQYSSNIVAIVNFTKASTKALTKASSKHVSKLDQSIGESNDSIIILSTNTPITKDTIDSRKLKFAATLEPFLEKYGKAMLNDFYRYWTEPNNSGTKFRRELEKTWDVSRRLETWAKNEKPPAGGSRADPTIPDHRKRNQL